MKITEKKIPGSKVNLTVELDHSDLDKYKSQALKRLSSQVKIDGFRQGRVPEDILLSYVGAEKLFAEVLDVAMPQVYSKAVQEKGIYPLDKADADIKSHDPLTLEFVVSVYPDVKVKNFDAKKIKKSEILVNKKEVTEMIDMFRDQVKERKEVSRAAKKGDTVEISFDGKNKEGVSQPGMKSEFHPLEIGSATFIPGFEDEVIGMKKGDEKTFPITFPKDYHHSDYAGKEFFFTVVAKTVFENVLPKLDEDFVEKITGTKNPVETLEEEVKSNLAFRKEQEDFAKRQNELFDMIAESTDCEVPEVFVSSEVEQMVDRIKMQGLQAGILWEKHLENLGKTEEQVKEDCMPEAIKMVKGRLGIEWLLKDLKVEALEEDIMVACEKSLARLSEKEQKKKKNEFKKGGRGWENEKNKIEVRMLIEMLLEVNSDEVVEKVKAPAKKKVAPKKTTKTEKKEK